MLGKMAAIKTIGFRYISIYEGNNNIGPKGCEQLSLNRWPLLSDLVLCNYSMNIANNHLSDIGYHYISKAKWP